MGKLLFIAEKPSVAREFAKVLSVTGEGRRGFMESDRCVVTWCVGHLVTMSYPEAYDPRLKKWTYDTLPFLPQEFKYEIIPQAAEQFKIVSSLLAREDVTRIYVCTDSGREGEYIYRLVEMMSEPAVAKKDRRRVWIDSFTEEEIKRGIREAKPLSDYDSLAASAYLRAKEDYLMGINFSRALTLKYGGDITQSLGGKWSAVSAGRVMTCVLGMVVRREREIRNFVKTPFYRLVGNFGGIEAEWKAVKGSAYAEEGKPSSENAKDAAPSLILSPLLYKENGFKNRRDAEELAQKLRAAEPAEGTVTALSKKKEKKYAPLLYNLAELQNDCAKSFKISPDETLKIAQELYEKKLTTYPRTDARVLSTAQAKVIGQNLRGLKNFPPAAEFADEILESGADKRVVKSRYTDDSAITDHFAIIPTGTGFSAYNSLGITAKKVYGKIVRRFLSIFYPPAVYEKLAITIMLGGESFFASARTLEEPGYLKAAAPSAAAQGQRGDADGGSFSEKSEGEEGAKEGKGTIPPGLKKGMQLPLEALEIKEGETSPPKRYSSGSIILAMENAGQLIEDEALREQIKGAGIGTSATRAEILKKLFSIGYLHLNKKTQVITPELKGEMVYDTVDASIRQLLNPELTASWEKGLSKVASGELTEAEYLEKLEGFVRRRTQAVIEVDNRPYLRRKYAEAARFYAKPKAQARNYSARRGPKKEKNDGQG